MKPLSARQRHPQLPKDQVRRLFLKLRKTNDKGIRATLIVSHLGLVEYLARRFAGRGEPMDDLVQVATIGLVKAVDRFDPEREVEFSTYAAPTILGEIKRHFRDKGWGLRVPRRLQELSLRLGPVIARLSQDLGRSPTVAEIARASRVSQDDVLEALDSAQAYTLASLDTSKSEESRPIHERVGDPDEHLEALEALLFVGSILQRLPARERRLLELRFFRGMTQSQIAREMGISQMHVSRLLSRTLAELRIVLQEDDGEDGRPRDGEERG